MINKEYWGFLPLPLFIGLIAALRLTIDPAIYYDPGWLIPVTNTLFVTLIYLTVAYVTMRSFAAKGQIQILLLGYGTLIFGLAAVSAGFARGLPAGANLNVTIYNTGALITALFFSVVSMMVLAGLSPAVSAPRRRAMATVGYLAAMIIAALLTMAALRGAIPPFFIQGAGPTPLRQAVLGTADVLFVLSFLIFIGTYFRTKEAFLYWCALSMALTSVSLTAFFIQSSVGSPVGWVGRLSQYVGGAYLLVALAAARSSARQRKTSFDNVLTFSLSSRERAFTSTMAESPNAVDRLDSNLTHIYLEQSADAFYVKDAQGRYLMFNSEAGRITGKRPEEVIGKDDYFLFSTAEAKKVMASDQKVMQGGQVTTFEEVVQTVKGTTTYSTTKGPLFDDYGKVVGLFGIARDITERKRVEKSLEENEKRYRTLFESMSIGVFYFSPDGSIMFANTAAIDILGIPLNEILNRNPADEGWKNIHEDGSEFPANSLPSTIASATGQSVKNVTIGIFNQREGAYRWVRGSAIPQYHSGDSSPYQVYVTMEDITDIKHAGEALVESEKKFRSVFEFSPLGMSMTEIDGTVHVNKAMAEMIGYSVEELNSINWRELTHQDDLQKTNDVIESILRCREPQGRLDKRYIHKDGSIIWTHVTTALLRNPDGTPKFLTTSVENITERKRMDSELRETNEYLNNLIDSANAPIIVWDPHLKITRFNHAFETLTGLKTEDVLGREIGLLFPEGKKKEFLGSIHQATNGECWDSIEIPILGKDGDVHIVLWSSATILGSDGETVVATIAQGQDITGLKQAKAELNALNVKLEERVLLRTSELQAANKELESFSYSVSHDLRAPLRSISGFSEIFLKEYEAMIPEKGREYLERVQYNAVHMGELIDSLLKLSQITRSTPSLERIDISALADRVAIELANDNPQRNVHVQIEPGMYAMADSRLIRSVLTNLISNAWKYTSKNEHAHISIGTLTDPQHGPAFFVRDDGAGFNNVYRDKLFVVFQRLHTDTEFTGTGIGLATVARIVRKHGGELWAEGEVDKGATFYFTLPEAL